MSAPFQLVLGVVAMGALGLCEGAYLIRDRQMPFRQFVQLHDTIPAERITAGYPYPRSTSRPTIMTKDPFDYLKRDLDNEVGFPVVPSAGALLESSGFPTPLVSTFDIPAYTHCYSIYFSNLPRLASTSEMSVNTTRPTITFEKSAGLQHNGVCFSNMTPVDSVCRLSDIRLPTKASSINATQEVNGSPSFKKSSQSSGEPDIGIWWFLIPAIMVLLSGWMPFFRLVKKFLTFALDQVSGFGITDLGSVIVAWMTGLHMRFNLWAHYRAVRDARIRQAERRKKATVSRATQVDLDVLETTEASTQTGDVQTTITGTQTLFIGAIDAATQTAHYQAADGDIETAAEITELKRRLAERETWELEALAVARQHITELEGRSGLMDEELHARVAFYKEQWTSICNSFDILHENFVKQETKLEAQDEQIARLKKSARKMRDNEDLLLARLKKKQNDIAFLKEGVKQIEQGFARGEYAKVALEEPDVLTE